MYKLTDLGNYESFLHSIISHSYEFVYFSELNKPYDQLILRHDIDFDVLLALEMARIEYELGIKASYFFLLTNDSYNPLSKVNHDAIHKIKSLGHQISIHFDPMNYSDYQSGFKNEKQLFEMSFNTNLDIISLHRPNDFFQNHNEKIGQCDHTYMAKYSKEIKYFSDSTGLFRYGHPFESEAFQSKRSIHLLIHPIWWMIEGQNNLEKLKNYYDLKKKSIKSHYAANCIPFKSIENELS